MHYTYVIESAKDGRWYTGVTGDLRTRLANRLKGQVRSTSHRRPLRLVYYEACLSEADARRRERYLKSGKGSRGLQCGSRKIAVEVCVALPLAPNRQHGSWLASLFRIGVNVQISFTEVLNKLAETVEADQKIPGEEKRSLIE